MSRKDKSTNRGKTFRKTRSEKRAARRKAKNLKDSATSLETRLLEPLAEIERIFNQMRDRKWYRPSGWDWPDLPSLFETRAPSVDVADCAKKIIVTAEIPGIHKDDLEISVTDRTLTIKGKSRHEEKTVEGDTQQREIQWGSFYRTLTLPTQVDSGKVTVECKDGILELHLPKSPGSRKHDIPLK